jgi:chemotaxis-related protein WspB
VPILVVCLEVAGERYGVEASRVVEVVPSVSLRTVPGTAHGIAGLLDFRGRLVPVVDLGLLWVERASPERMSTRIVVASLAGDRRVGLRAERVTRVARVDPDAQYAGPGPESRHAGLGRLVRHEDGVLQLVSVEDLVPADVLAALERSPEAVA